MASRAYRLKEGEALGEGVRRIAVGRIDHALEELRGETDSTPEEAVHEARKNLKKLRSLLRLMRGGLDRETFRTESACFRDAGLELAGRRDADVMLATLDELGLEPEQAGPLRQSLEAHRLQLGAGGPATEPVIRRLDAARLRALGWALSGDGFEVLEPGLRKAYRRGRRRMRALGAPPGVEELHEWRKRVKDLWYHHTLLRQLWPPVMLAVGDEAHELSERLGVDHDLAMLLDWARRHSQAVPSELAAAVDERRAILQAEALALGRRLFADRPRAFTARLEAWWDVAPSRTDANQVV